MHPNLDALKAFCGGALAVASWAGGQIAQSIDTIPDIVKAADTPLIIIGLGYGCVHLWRELKATNAARIADRDSYIATGVIVELFTLGDGAWLTL